MPRINKYLHQFIVQGSYGQGWEDVDTHDTYTDARRSLKEYRENETDYPHRVIQRRVLNPAFVDARKSTANAAKRTVLSDTRIIKYLAACPNCGSPEAEYTETVDNIGNPGVSYVFYICRECHTSSRDQ